MSSYETPSYEVLLKDGSIELRHYPRFWIVKYAASNDPYAEAAFQTLFSYIQGNNQAKEKIAMTVPVYQTLQDQVQSMSFVVPEKYIRDIPKPNHPNIHIEPFEAGVYAVITFSGTTSRSNIEKHETLLSAWLKTNGHQAVTQAMSATYNPPFSLPFMRRNELMIKVAYEGVLE